VGLNGVASIRELMAVEVPEGTSGAFRVERFEVPPNSLEGLRLAWSGRPCAPGIYTRLTQGDLLWMSDTPAERRDHLGAALSMRERGGRVLIGGLGLGMIVRAALLGSPVEHVDVLETNEDVIALVGPHYQELAEKSGKTIAVHRADVFTWAPPRGERWSVAYFDVWSSLCGDNLPAMAALGRRYNRRRADECLCWGRELLRSEQRRERGMGW
jgi:hypothetical protein